MFKFGRPVFCQLRITGAGAGIPIVRGKSPVAFKSLVFLIMGSLNKRIGFYVKLFEVSYILFRIHHQNYKIFNFCTLRCLLEPKHSRERGSNQRP